MATKGYRLAAKTALAAMIAAGALLSCPPVAGADDPEQPAEQGQEACTGGDQGQPQDPQACGAGIANRAIGEAKNAADQAARSAGQEDRPPNDVITNSRCFMHNGVPTLGEVGVAYDARGPFVHPDEGKPCWAVYGVSPTH